MPYDPAKFADLLARLVDEGHSQRKLAKMAGVSEATIRNWRKGRNGPTLENLYGLADGLKLQIGELLGETDANRDALRRLEDDLDRMSAMLDELTSRRQAGG